MRNALTIAAGAAFAFAAFAVTPTPAREPQDPGAWWVHPDAEDAERYARAHPAVSLCAVAVPDGIATYRCPRIVRG